MNTALSWIKAYVPDLDVTAQEYTDAMTLTGTKVEGYERLDKNLEKKMCIRDRSAVEVSVSPSSAAYGSTITITAEISRDTNTLTRTAAQNKVDFYLGTCLLYTSQVPV